MTLGYRFKRKINNIYSLGWIINCNLKSFDIKQNALKIFPTNIISEKEKLLTRNLALGLYNRFNFGKRGNYIGNFIDVGANFEWNFYPTFVINNKNIFNASLSGNTKQIQSNLKFNNASNYCIAAALGFNKYVIYSTYRLSNIFRNSFNFPELPRFIVGLQLGLHQ